MRNCVDAAYAAGQEAGRHYSKFLRGAADDTVEPWQRTMYQAGWRFAHTQYPYPTTLECVDVLFAYFDGFQAGLQAGCLPSSSRLPALLIPVAALAWRVREAAKQGCHPAGRT